MSEHVDLNDLIEDYDYLCIRTPFCATDRDAHGKACVRENDRARREHYEAEYDLAVMCIADSQVQHEGSIGACEPRWTDEAIEALGIPVIGDSPIHHPSCPRRHVESAPCRCVETLTR